MPRRRIDENKHTKRLRAWVTGASSGIGAAFATRLADDGFHVIVITHRRNRLDTPAKQLQASYPVNIQVLVVDFSKRDSLRKVEKRVAEDPASDLLINNAGLGGYMPFIELDPDKAEELINLKVVAVSRLTRVALPIDDHQVIANRIASFHPIECIT